MDRIAACPGLEGVPVYITECDIDWGVSTSIYHNPNLHYRNSEYFAAFQCALVAELLSLRRAYPRNPIQAACLDTFYLPGQRVFEGQRTLVTGENIDLPILNALRVLGQLGQQQLAVRPEGTAQPSCVCWPPAPPMAQCVSWQSISPIFRRRRAGGAERQPGGDAGGALAGSALSH